MAIFQKQKKDVQNVATVAQSGAPVKASPYPGVVLGPRVTEKATDSIASSRIYSFNVSQNANKRMVKEVVESLHGVHVSAVRMVNIPRKRRMRGRLEGWKSGHKKALVKVREGEVIEFTEEKKKASPQ